MQPPAPITVTCPRCTRVSRCPGKFAGRIVGCPHCRSPITVPAIRPSGIPGPSLPPAPQLTGPHHCPIYDCPNPLIHHPIGARVLEIVHSPCQRRISLFSAIYRCPQCLHPRMLESPRPQWNQSIRCTSGLHDLTVPDDLILRECDPYQEEGPRMRFLCPGCRTSLEVGARYAGRWAVCLRCALAIQVPSSGENVPLPQNPVGASEKVWIRCPNDSCRRRVPHEFSVCPDCNEALHG